MITVKVAALLRLPLFVVGLILFYAAERYFSADRFYLALWVSGLVLAMLGALAPIIAGFWARRDGLYQEARAWYCAAAWQFVVVGGCVVYKIYMRVLGTSPAPETIIGQVLLVVWLLALILGFAAGIGIETARFSAGRGALAESRRVARAGFTWLMVGMVLCSLIAINYGASKKDKAFDWSYLKTTRPSEATAKLLQTLTEPLNIAVFFPKDNEVRPFVEEYTQALTQLEKKVSVSFYDKDLHPTQAEKYRVSRNGQMLLEVGDKRERIDIGLNLSSARSVLKNFDNEFQKAFLALTAARKIAYFTRGHGEMSWLASNEDPLYSLKRLEAIMRSQNYSLRFFGAAEGSAQEINKEASVVVIAGANQPFLKEEVAALQRYLQAGGKALIFLDNERPDQKPAAPGQKRQDDPLLKMLAEIGIDVRLQILGNDRNYVKATSSPADFWFLFTNVFTSHESVSNLARNEERIGVLVFQSAYMEVTPEAHGWKNFEIVKALSDTFVDANKNFRFDADTEKRNSYVIGTASTYKAADAAAPEGRLIVFSDATMISDALLHTQVPGNLLLLLDSLKWLAGESHLAGAQTSEEDIKILHTRKEDLVWFWGSVVAVPLLVLLAGFLATRKRHAGRISDHAAA